MADSLEQELRRALAPQDPGDLFTQRVLARLPERHASPVRRTRWAWLSAAVAASVVGATVLHQQYQERRQGELAKTQLLEALRLTSAKLDLAYRAVDQENRS
jgi:uncharacterized membrane protein